MPCVSVLDKITVDNVVASRIVIMLCRRSYVLSGTQHYCYSLSYVLVLPVLRKTSFGRI